MAETALIVLVPEAEPYVQRWRATLNPVAVRGIPAHITLVYPFLPPPRLTPPALADLEDVLAGASPFHASLVACRRFPRVLYLAPEPTSPCVALVERVVGRFPDAQPYGGRFTEVIPHVTVAQADAPSVLDAVEKELSPALPIDFRVDRAVLYVEEAGFWRPYRVFSIGSSTPWR